MIITTFDQLGRYKALSPNLAAAIDYLDSVNPQTLQAGREPVAGDDIYMVMQHYLTRRYQEGKFETHDRYIDIQYLVDGKELFHYAPRSAMCDPGAYDADNDKTNYADNEGADCIHFQNGTVIICFPEDAHKACTQCDDSVEPVRKLLLKVRV